MVGAEKGNGETAMRLDPDDYRPDLVSAYQRLNREFQQLAPHLLLTDARSVEANFVRQSLSDRRRVLEDLSRLLLGDVERRLGAHLLPLGKVTVYLN